MAGFIRGLRKDWKEYQHREHSESPRARVNSTADQFSVLGERYIAALTALAGAAHAIHQLSPDYATICVFRFEGFDVTLDRARDALPFAGAAETGRST